MRSSYKIHLKRESVDKLSKLNILIMGFGVSGKGAYNYLHDKVKKLYIVNSGPISSWAEDDLNAHLFSEEKFSSAFIEALDYVILSPGVPRERAWKYFKDIKNFEEKRMVSDIEFFSYLFKEKIIAITGTNGKTTTVSLLQKILESADQKVFTGGNIGTSVFCGLDHGYEIALLEVSSFQLESCFDFSPDAAAILNVRQNHGERYSSFESYRQAKMRIFKNMNSSKGLMIYPRGELTHALPSEAQVLTDLKPFLKSFKLKGKHNLDNLWVATKIAQFFDVKKDDIIRALDGFYGVPFRCQNIFSDAQYVILNDAKSTNWDATQSAVENIESIEKKHRVLILGGQNRGHGDSPPLEFMQLCQRLKINVILTGESGKSLKDNFPQAFYHESLKEILLKIKKEYRQAVILFSPAFPSFDQYTNYVERGEHLNHLVEDIFKD